MGITVNYFFDNDLTHQRNDFTSVEICNLIADETIMLLYFNTSLRNMILVVAQDYNLEVRVVNGGSAKGCTAVLECVAPTFMKDLVRVVSWLQEPGFYIYPSLQGGKYIILFTFIYNYR